MKRMRDTIHALQSLGRKPKDQPSPEETPIPPLPDHPPAINPEELDLFTGTTMDQELLECLSEPGDDDTIRMNITIPRSLKKRFKARCDEDGRTMSGVVNLWVKRYLSMLIILAVSLKAADTTYTTQQILSFVEKPAALPDLTLTANARGGFGTPEMFDAPPRGDVYSGLYARMDILSTAEIRKRKEEVRSRQSLVLHNLSKILTHEQFISFLHSQKSVYLRRKKLIQKRIDKGFSDQADIIPIEQHLIAIETKLQTERGSIRESQLTIAGLVGDKWNTLFNIIKNWDRAL